MDIKERFYANLNMIREDYDSKAADDAKGAKRAEKMFKKASKEEPSWNKKWHDDAAAGFAKKAKKLFKKAVTGMDEEAENIHEGIEKGNPNIVRLRRSQAAAQKALRHVNKNRYEEAHAAVEGTPLAKNLRSYLDRAQKHWTKMNIANNKAGKTSTSSDEYDRLRSLANDHQDRAESHHDKAVQYLKDHLP